MRVTALLLTLALAVRLAACEYALATGALRFPDTELYRAYAERIAAGADYAVGNDAAQRTPGYPLFLAACWRIFGEGDRAILWTQACFSTASCYLVWRLTKHATTVAVAPLDMAANAALAFAAFDPFAVVGSATMLAECLFTFALVLAAFFWQRDSIPAGIAAGVVAGVATMIRPSGLLLFLAMPMLTPLALGGVRRTASLAGLLALVATLAPWTLRNAHRFGAFLPTALNVGESLYDGLNPRATGASDMTFATDAKVRALPEVERDRHWRALAIEFARANPLRVVELSLKKLDRMWSPWPNESRFRSRAVIVATFVASVVVYGLAICGAVRVRWFIALGLLAPAIYFSGLHAIFVGSVRYRIPVLPFLDALAGIGLASLLRRRISGGDHPRP